MKPIALVTLLFFMACTPPPVYQIKSKWSAYPSHDNLHLCEACDANSRNCCQMDYNGIRYQRTESYILDKKGKIDSIYSYKVPLGVNVFSIEEYEELAFKEEVEEMKLRKIYWDTINEQIIDKKDSISNFEVDKINRYLVVKSKKKIVLYSY